MQNTFFPENVKTQYLNYLKHYKKLLNIKRGTNENDIKLIKSKIREEKILKSPGLLMEKAEELLA